MKSPHLASAPKLPEINQCNKENTKVTLPYCEPLTGLLSGLVLSNPTVKSLIPEILYEPHELGYWNKTCSQHNVKVISLGPDTKLGSLRNEGVF